MDNPLDDLNPHQWSTAETALATAVWRWDSRLQDFIHRNSASHSSLEVGTAGYRILYTKTAFYSASHSSLEVGTAGYRILYTETAPATAVWRWDSRLQDFIHKNSASHSSLEVGQQVTGFYTQKQRQPQQSGGGDSRLQDFIHKNSFLQR